MSSDLGNTGKIATVRQVIFPTCAILPFTRLTHLPNQESNCLSVWPTGLSNGPVTGRQRKPDEAPGSMIFIIHRGLGAASKMRENPLTDQSENSKPLQTRLACEVLREAWPKPTCEYSRISNHGHLCLETCSEVEERQSSRGALCLPGKSRETDRVQILLICSKIPQDEA